MTAKPSCMLRSQYRWSQRKSALRMCILRDAVFNETRNPHRTVLRRILQVEDFLERVSVNFEVSPVLEGNRVEPQGLREVGMCLRGDWYRLRAREGTFPVADPVKSMDVQVRWITPRRLARELFVCLFNPTSYYWEVSG